MKRNPMIEKKKEFEDLKPKKECSMKTKPIGHKTGKRENMEPYNKV